MDYVYQSSDHSEPLKEPSSSSESLSGATSVVVSPRKLIQRIAGSRSNEVDHLKEVVGKLQRALEEALMKNIHLQEVSVHSVLMWYSLHTYVSWYMC